MHSTLTRRVVTAFIALLLGHFGFVQPLQAAKQIEWETLQPKLAPIESPITRLTPDQRIDLETVFWVHEMSEEEKLKDTNEQAVELARDYEKNLQNAGLDVERLVREFRIWRKARADRRKVVNQSLNDQDIRMAGYLLPLSFSEKGETEFLLVPYFGACVHTPPPPANQIVYVKLAKKFVAQDMFTPVWISGRMRTGATSKAVAFGDGDRDIDIGYRVEGANIEPYTE